MEKVTNSPEQTVKLGFQWGQKILEVTKEQKRALVLSLEGKLGTGKTTFIQGLAKGLGVEESVTSPTFLIIKKYKLKHSSSFHSFYHVDCYRLESPQELLRLGIEDIFKDPKAVVAVEWGQKVKSILPERVIVIKFKHISKGERKITAYNDHDYDNDLDLDLDSCPCW